MIVLGIANSKDSGACLMIDGKLVSAINEERLVRRKMTNEFPILSIDWVLKKNCIELKDVDAIGTGVWKGINSSDMFSTYIGDAFKAQEANLAAANSINENEKQENEKEINTKT